MKDDYTEMQLVTIIPAAVSIALPTLDKKIHMAKYQLMPNESMILQEVSVAHGSVMAICTDELLLTSLNLVCVHKGVFGNMKNVFTYPLSQIKRFKGKPQVMMGKLSNREETLDVYLNGGECESFYFQTKNKRTIKNWIEAIMSACGFDSSTDDSGDVDDGYDSDTLAGAFKEVGDQFKEVENDFFDALGFKPRGKTKKSIAAGVASAAGEKVSKKCMSCSAPIFGNKGQTVKCKYCDTEQTL